MLSSTRLTKKLFIIWLLFIQQTVNTTARIETTGAKNKIHISVETADRLIAAGKEHWVTLREDKVVAKGKGELQTYWLKLKKDASSSVHSGEESGSIISESHDESEAFGHHLDSEHLASENKSAGKQLGVIQESPSMLPAKQNRILLLGMSIFFIIYCRIL